MAINNTAAKSKAHNAGACNNGGSSSDGDGNSNSNSPSPPQSPRRYHLVSVPQCRRRLRSKVQSQFRRESLAAGIFLRWNSRYLLLPPLLYVCGLILCVRPFAALLQPSLPGAVYRSHEMLVRLWPEILADNSTAIQLSSVWKFKRKLKVQKPCPNSTARQYFPANGESAAATPNGYLIVEANGGLNQQRSAICNAVALAGLLNAILVIPYFEFNSIWRDPSEFGDIYDQDHFIATLEGYVKVVKELPAEVMERFDYNFTSIPNIRVQAWAPANYYLGAVYPILQEKGVIRIAPFANRLAMSVPSHIQLLRCLANYRALRFSSSISTLGEKLVNRMIERSSRSGGKYVSVHLRFEEDMVAFSCCVYDGGIAEKLKMNSLRQIVWKGKFKRKDRVILPGFNRIEGKCPLTPLEVGMMLRGMGFDNNTAIYLAAGKIYDAERHLAPLLKMFPLLYTKELLATRDELAPFEGYSSRLAALDYTVCLYSEVFVTTQGGNFPHFLMGHRRFLFDGHAKTIMPDKRKLVILLQDMQMSWKSFKDQMEIMLTDSDRKGLMVPRVRKINRKTSIYTYPLPECGCLQSHNTSSLKLSHTTNTINPQLDLVL